MDNYIVSARKYRPTTFNTVIGQLALTTTLKNAIKGGHLAHAYLFCGPRGVGKTTCARIFAKTINCLNLGADSEACNQCESCVSFNEQRSYNIHELDAASNNSVDDIRSLIDQVRIPPQIGKYSVYIVDEVHMLSSGAFNAFLKTLEEPPSHALFILATTEKHKIIPTILSRCQIYDFNRISVSDTVSHLQQIAAIEGVVVDPDALNVVAQKCDGGMRDALSIFDQLVSFCGNNISYQGVIENLNVLDYEYYFNLIEQFIQGNVSKSLLILNEIINKGFDAHHFITGLSSHIRDVLVSKDPQTLVLLEVGDSIVEKYKTQAQICSTEFLFQALKISNDCDRDYRTSKNKRLLVELTLIRLCQLTDEKKKSIILDNNSTEIKPVFNIQEQNLATKVSESQSQQSVYVNEAEKPVIVNSPPQKFSISLQSRVVSNSETKEKVSQLAPTTENHPFSVEDLEMAWKRFAEKITDQHMIGLIKSSLPRLIESDVFEISVFNKIQESEYQNYKSKIENFVRNELQNTSINFRVKMVEQSSIDKAINPEQRYLKMAETNPAIEFLRKGLQMEID
jgi:DNA polymerase-3 subunit gamma/tau